MDTPKQTKAGRSKEARARKQLSVVEFFFYQHAGYSWNPKTETQEQGRIRCAKELAEAELQADRRNWSYEWSDDWSIGSHKKFYGEDSAYADHEPSSCESCVLRDEDGNVLASLGCIDDADNNYRRVIEAELTDEALTHEHAAQQREAELQRMIDTAYAL